jgi:hypothetical protein
MDPLISVFHLYSLINFKNKIRNFQETIPKTEKMRKGTLAVFQNQAQVAQKNTEEK